MSRQRDDAGGCSPAISGGSWASLVLAMLLWFAIVGEPELVTTHTVPILYRNLPPDLLIGSDAVDQVRVELRGPVEQADRGEPCGPGGAARSFERQRTRRADLHVLRLAISTCRRA